MISFALLLIVSNSHFVAPNSRIVNEQHYVTLIENQLHLYDEVGTRTSSIKLPPTPRPEFQGGVEGPALATDNPDISIRIEVKDGKLVLRRQSATVSLTSDHQSFRLRMLESNTAQERTIRIEPFETYQRSDPSRMQESRIPINDCTLELNTTLSNRRYYEQSVACH